MDKFHTVEANSQFWAPRIPPILFTWLNRFWKQIEGPFVTSIGIGIGRELDWLLNVHATIYGKTKRRNE